MCFPYKLRPNSKGSQARRLGLVEVLLTSISKCQAIQRCCCVSMFRTKHELTNCQCTEVCLLCPFIVLLKSKYCCQAVVCGAPVSIIRERNPFSQLYGATKVGFGGPQGT